MNPDWVYLTQTDTTAGFLSQKASRLAAIKGRPPGKPFLKEVASCRELQRHLRVPKAHRKRVRRSRRTTFLYPQQEAIRLVHDPDHLRFLERFGWMYSTSANPSGKPFDPEFARRNADVVVEDWRGIFAGDASQILHLGRRRIKRIR
ncbi:MAG: Sua5 YciO YrdC YwlC family protein [Nitratiruptor sp.]|nr:Sua5 YciO YrdC YwlC family protein [Nitratiruptor sp.]NPA84181.1 Sua5 YciO YrdC YwlC family protein [Campylobacterota bacterium]